ncbi:hypothetical protein AWZ03_006813 [Drosophila navojoa]|uniref:Uncharacterized protein n=1 Tax=Drosophila navojoa TaxID=7232 RepID=A0A484BD38_DRONA|nr:hypothetical protein AWZ03_006813 [Drosophila navojoa]
MFSPPASTRPTIWWTRAAAGGGERGARDIIGAQVCQCKSSSTAALQPPLNCSQQRCSASCPEPMAVQSNPSTASAGADVSSDNATAGWQRVPT